MKIKYVKVNPKAHAPTRAHSSDAGYDLYSTEYLKIEPFERTLVSTGLIIEIPNGFYGRIAPRSGLACKKGIDVMAGVIDSGYRGEWKVCLLNTSDKEFEIKRGDKIAQALIQPIISAEIEHVDELEESSRKDGAFGSTGR